MDNECTGYNGTFWSAGNILYVGWDGGFMGHTCQNSSTCTLKMDAFCCM